jgi:hypothetical protein
MNCTDLRVGKKNGTLVSHELKGSNRVSGCHFSSSHPIRYEENHILTTPTFKHRTIAVHRDLPVVTPTLRPGDERALGFKRRSLCEEMFIEKHEDIKDNET